MERPAPRSLGELLDRPALEARLRELGFPADAVRGKAETLGRCAQSVASRGAERDAKAVALVVPGRIEVLGKHTDYAGGRSLLAATVPGFVAVATRGEGPALELEDIERGESIRIAVPLDTETSAEHEPAWALYPRVAVARLLRHFPDSIRGARVAFASDLPPAAGLSSSSALLIALTMAIAEISPLADLPRFREIAADPLRLATFLAAIESGAAFEDLPGDHGVGTHGGSQDHTAILCSASEALGVFRFAPGARERSIPFPPGLVFAVAASGVLAEKAGAARERYNRLSRLARASACRAGEILGVRPAHLGDLVRDPRFERETVLRGLRETSDDSADESTFPGAELAARLQQFLEETETLIPGAAEALARGDLPGFGTLVDRSHREGDRLLRNQVPETRALVRLARELGAHASSAFGAGFGGSVHAVVESDGAAEFLGRWRERYLAEFPAASAGARFLVTRPGPAASFV